MILTKSIKKNLSQQNASNDTFCIESSNTQLIKRDRKKSKIIFRWNQFCHWFKFLFFINHVYKLINDYFNQLINNSNYFLIENLFYLFQFIDLKQKKINDLLNFFFKFVNKRNVLSNICMFNARFVNEIKNENTKKNIKNHV